MAVKLGDLLLKAKLITQDQLDAALKSQREEGGKIGEALVRVGGPFADAARPEPGLVAATPRSSAQPGTDAIAGRGSAGFPARLRSRG